MMYRLTIYDNRFNNFRGTRVCNKYFPTFANIFKFVCDLTNIIVIVAKFQNVLYNR